MKNLFRGYYKLNEKEIKAIWATGFISIDTNVLFNIYRYSEDTRKDLIKVLKKYSSKLWLTNHSAYEFHKNRITVINEQIKIYEETIKSFEKLENDIIKNLKTPHLSKKVLVNFKKIIRETIKDLDKKKMFYKRLLFKDTILSTITSIFNKKVGAAFSLEEINKIEKEGEDRYKRKIPPGFKDNDKTDNKFGDLIIWKELIQKSKSENRPFILIIDDIKEDWLLKVQGETISPRQELSQELYKEANQYFHLYTSDRFLEFSSKTEKVKQETIDEVREIRLDENLIRAKYPIHFDLPRIEDQEKFVNVYNLWKASMPSIESGFSDLNTSLLRDYQNSLLNEKIVQLPTLVTKLKTKDSDKKDE